MPKKNFVKSKTISANGLKRKPVIMAKPLPPPLEVITPTDTKIQTQVLPLTVIVCCLVLLVSFGSSMMAGIINISVPAARESSEKANNFNQQRILNYDIFNKNYGNNLNLIRYLDVYTKSTATYRYSQTDQCMIGTSKSVASCPATNANCQLREWFVVYNTDNKPRFLSQVRYKCPLGCSKGACVRPPVCTDSDLDSGQTFPYISGQSSPFVKGTTSGLMNGVVTSTTDVCFNSNQLTEYYCSNGEVTNTGITCENGCVNGACVLIKSRPIILSSSLPNNNLVNGYVTIAKFNVYAVDGDIAWKKINFKYSFNTASTSISLSDCSLINNYGSVMQASVIVDDYNSGAGSNIAIDLANEAVIMKDNTNSYSLRCSINGSIYNTALFVKLDGDSISSVTPMSYSGIVTAGEKRFVWSDRSVMPHSLDSLDWYGSDGIQQLPLQSDWTLLFR